MVSLIKAFMIETKLISESACICLEVWQPSTQQQSKLSSNEID
jgi:hypothetical protein